MTPVLYDYPSQAKFGRAIPKHKIYEHSAAGKALKRLFVQQVEQIVWQYKLAPEIVNLPGKPEAPEIQVIDLQLKTGVVHNEVLAGIDKAIPFPLIFQLHWQRQLRVSAAYKRPHAADPGKWVIGDYLSSGWLPADMPRQPLPLALDLTGLYEQMIRQLLPLTPRTGETLPDQLERWRQIGRKQQELKQFKIKLQKEKQFNRKVEINSQMRRIDSEIEQLSNIS